MKLALYYAASLFVGGIPFALLLGWLRRVDLRHAGSGNVGATNLARLAGLPWGVLAFLGDAAKGAGPVLFGVYLVPERPAVAVLGGAAAVIGHCYSPYLRFRGGKGVATTGGVLLALAPWSFLVLVSCWGALLGVLRNVGVSSSGTALVGMGLGGWSLSVAPVLGLEAPAAVFLVVICVLVIVRHRSNLEEFFRPRRVEAES